MFKRVSRAFGAFRKGWCAFWAKEIAKHVAKVDEEDFQVVAGWVRWVAFDDSKTGAQKKAYVMSKAKVLLGLAKGYVLNLLIELALTYVREKGLIGSSDEEEG